MPKRARSKSEEYEYRRDVILECLNSLQDGTSKSDQIEVLQDAIDLCANLMTWEAGFDNASAYFEETARRMRTREAL